LEAFLGALPRGGQYAFEFRDHSWFVSGVREPNSPVAGSASTIRLVWQRRCGSRRPLSTYACMARGTCAKVGTRRRCLGHMPLGS
jgi:hypothetical protein